LRYPVFWDALLILVISFSEWKGAFEFNSTHWGRMERLRLGLDLLVGANKGELWE